VGEPDAGPLPGGHGCVGGKLRGLVPGHRQGTVTRRQLDILRSGSHSGDRLGVDGIPSLMAAAPHPSVGRASRCRPLQFREACVRCPALRPDPAQRDRLTEIARNLEACMAEAREHGWRGEVSGLEATLAKLDTMSKLCTRDHQPTYARMPTAARTPAAADQESAPARHLAGSQAKESHSRRSATRPGSVNSSSAKSAQAGPGSMRRLAGIRRTSGKRSPAE
jgi:hypothetical protein